MENPIEDVRQKALLLEYLFQQLAHLKKTKIRQYLKYGSVEVNGKVTTSHNHELKPGDRVRILNSAEIQRRTLEADLGFPIVYEDDDLIVIDKPAGLLTIATDKEKVQTAYYRLTAYHRAKSKTKSGRIFIVHRLDREASGLVVFAKNEEIKTELQNNWDKSSKLYTAITEGMPIRYEGSIQTYLIENRTGQVYSSHKPSRGAKESLTLYRVVRDYSPYALLEIDLKTGRKHQIRVHMAELGCPIVGDDRYGAVTDPIHRLALHAHQLSFQHPATGKQVRFDAPLPKSFQRLI